MSVTREFIDAGVSGAKSSRPELDELMESARNGEIDTVLISKFDRLDRSIIHMLTLIDELDDLKVQVVSISEGFDSVSSVGRFQVSILASVAEFERARITERITEGRIARIKEGGFTNSLPPTGYKTVPDPRGRGVVLAIDPVKSKTVRRIFDLVVVQKVAISEAVEVLNKEGHTTGRNNPWTISRLQSWVRDPEAPLRSSGNRVSSGHRMTHEPIITDVEAAQWQAWINETARHRARSGKYLHSGLITTKQCSRGLTGRDGSASKYVQQRIYVCSDKLNYTVGDPLRCGDPSISLEAMDATVWGHVVGLLSDRPTQEALISQAWRSMTEVGCSQDDLMVRVDELRSLVVSEYQDILDAGFDAATARFMVAGRQEELNTVLRDLSKWQGSPLLPPTAAPFATSTSA